MFSITNRRASQNTTNKLSKGKRASLLKAAILGVLALSPAVASADLNWDANGATAGTGGAGTWDTTSNLWTPDFAAYGTWPAGGDDLAIFGGTAGVVTANSLLLKANGMQFDVTGYSITGAGQIELITGSLGSPLISVTNLADTATIGVVLAGTSGLLKVGEGTLELTATNTMTGSVLITDGTVRISTVGALNSAADISVGFNKTLEYSGAGAGTLTPTVSTVNSNLAVSNATGNLTVASLAGFGMTKTGAGTLTLSGANAGYSGETAIAGGKILLTNSLALQGSVLNYDNQGGTLDVGTLTAVTLGGLKGAQGLALDNSTPAAVALTLNNSTDEVYSGVLSGAGSLIKDGFGTQTLANTANTYAGTTTINNGTLALGGAGSISAAGLILNGGTISSSSATAITLNNAVTVSGNFGMGQSVGGTGAVTLSSNLDLGGVARTVTVNNPTSTLSGIISNGALTKDGVGTLVLSNVNTYAGVTQINAGTISIAAATGIGDGTATNTIGLNGGTLRATATMDLGVNRTTLVGGGGGALSAATGQTLTVSGAVSGTGNLSAAGGGVVLLTADNSAFGGSMSVDSVSGNTTNTTLRLGSANALMTTGTVTLNAGLAVAGGNGNTLEMNGFSTGAGVSLVLNAIGGAPNNRSTLLANTGTSTWAGSIQYAGDGNVGLNSSTGATLTINGNITGPGYTGTSFLRGVGNGVINGTINMPAGSIAKTDSGTWRINSTGNSWLNTQVSVGSLILGAADALPTTTVVTMGQNDGNNATLDLNGFGQTIAGLASNPTSGITGTKTVTNSVTGTPVTLTINGTTNTTYAGIISGALSLVKQGSGIQAIAGANTYTGTTTIDSGASLQVGNKSSNSLALPAGTAVTNNGTLIFAPGTTGLTYNNPITGNGAIVMDGLSTATPAGITLSGDNSGFNGTYTINQGRLAFTSQTGVGPTTLPITVNGTASNGGQLWVNAAVTIANPLTLNGYGASETAGNLGAVRMNNGSTLSGAITLGSNASIHPDSGTGTITGNISGGAGAQLLYGTPGTGRNSSVIINSPGGNTYSGGTLIRVGTGTVSANVAGALGTGPVDVQNGTLSLNVAGAVASGQVTLSGGTLRQQYQSSTVAAAGVNGLNATYYNFYSNPGTASTRFASDQLLLIPQAFSRIDQQTNIPQAGSGGTIPIIPVPGFAMGTGITGGQNDGVLWKGLLNITNAGSYQFKGTNDDNLTLYIDGVQIGSIGVTSPLVNIGSAVNLTAGAHSIVIKQTQGGGGGYATVRYNGGAGSDAPTDELLGTDAGSITTGSLAAIDMGPQVVTAASAIEALNDITIPTLSLGNGTLTFSSQTLNTASVGTTTLTVGAATPGIASSGGGVTFTGAIGDGGNALGLNVAGPGLAEFQATNTYGGTTTVTGGQLRLNAAGGNSIPASLVVNATNPQGDVVNVRLLQSNQIADSGSLTMTAGILDLGANSDTISTITMDGGRIIGSGTLTVNLLGFSSLTGGTISANLAGAGPLLKSGAGTLVLGGNNTYTGTTMVSGGTLRVQGGTLGASGVGNETSVLGGAQLLMINGSSPAEVVNVEDNNGLRVRGIAGLGTVNYTALAAAPVLTVDAGGELTLSTALTSTANIAKEGAGTLTFAYDVGATLPANVLHNAGALGFSGTQSFGAAVIPANRQFKFNSDPGAGVNVTAPAGTAVIAGYAVDQALVSRVNNASTGSLALGVDSSNNLDLSAVPDLSLGAVGTRTYSGTINPGVVGYRLGGGGGELRVTSALTGFNALTVGQSGVVVLAGANTFSGSVNLDGAGRLRVINNSELGNAGNTINLSNGGTLELIGTVQDSGKKDQLVHQLGNPVGTSARVINVGTGGGTINLVAWANQATAYGLTGVNTLTGSGDLLKQGFGELTLLASNNYSGNLTLDEQGGRIYLRSGGALPSVASLIINQSAEVLLNNTGGIGSRQFPENPGSINNNRLNDNVAITLRGGAFRLNGNDAITVNENEFVGTVTLDVGRNQLEVTSNGGTGGVGAQLSMANLVRTAGGGVVNIVGTNTVGLAGGNNSRLVPALLNGAAIPASTATGTTLPWAIMNSTDFAAIGVTSRDGIAIGASTNQAAGTGFVPVAATRYNFNTTAASQTLTLAAGNQEMQGFRFIGNQATPSLLFGGAADTLFIGDGVVISDNNNQTRTIGAAATRGQLTAGGAAAAAGAKELIFHANQGTLAVESVIVDNNGAVQVHKGVGGGTLELRAVNTYSGGTIVHAGRVNAIVAGALGSGPVLVKGAAIQLNQPGATSSTAGITVRDRTELYLQNLTGVYTQPGDRFILEGPGNVLTGSIITAGQGLNSVTRVSTITGGGQVILPPDSIVRGVNVPTTGPVDAFVPANLGTSADLYFNTSATVNLANSITVGSGTPWKGISSAMGGAWAQGTINANSDFYLQGQNRLAGNTTFTIGAINNAGSWTLNNLAGRPINVYLEGRIDMAEDAPFALPSDVTFVMLPGSEVRPNVSQQFGSDSIGLSRAKLLAKAGSTLNPGDYVGSGSAVNQATGVRYPLPSPVNTFATFEAGSRFVIDDNSGIGSTTGGATWTMKTGSVLHLANSNALLGSNAGLINANQFVYEPGAIVRIEADRIIGLDNAINNQVGGEGVILEIFNGSRNVTDFVNPFVTAAVGTATVVPQSITLGAGGGITNDAVDRTMNERRGNVILNNGATLSATTQTVLNIDESFTVAAGATVNIGGGYVDGLPKSGIVQFQQAASKAAGPGAVFNVVNGGELSFNAVHVFPDTATLHLADAVDFTMTTGTTSPYIGNGSSVLLNNSNYIEVVGMLTGNGAVFSNQDDDNTALAAGWGATSDFTFNGKFGTNSGYTNRSPSLIKVGPTRMTLTNTSPSPTGATTNSPAALIVLQGELALSGPDGKWTGGEMRLGRGGTLIFDNSGTAITDRQTTTGTGNRWLNTLGGGDFRVLGHATQVADVAMFGIANGSGAGGFGNPGGNTGGFATVTVVPAPATTSLTTSVTFGTTERFDNTGDRNTVWLVRGTGMGGLPGSYNSAGVYTPNAGNPVDGLVFIGDPNFLAANTYDSSGNASGIIHGGPGTPVAPVKGDLLASANVNAGTAGNWSGIDFATIDVANGASRTGVRMLQASEYASTTYADTNLPVNIRTSSVLALNNGDTRFQVAKLENGGGLSVAGTLPNLTQPAQVVVNAGGILVPEGATASIAAAGNAVVRSNGGISAYVHAIGDLNVSGNFFSDQGLVKSGPGTATFAAGSLTALRGRIALHDGTLSINDSFANVRNNSTSASSFDGIQLELNGGTLNLNGKSQYFGRIESGNILPGAGTEGGTLTSATPATVTLQGGGTFSGHITGAISVDKVANNTWLLTNSNPFTGTLRVRQGTVLLRDSGTIPNVDTIDLNYARIDIDNGYLSNIDNRLKPTVTLNMRGGDFINRGRAATLTQQTLGTVNLLQGHNLFQTLAGGGGATETIIGDLVRTAGATAAFQQNNGFVGTAGNDTTAIRYLPTMIDGAATSTKLVNNILPTWMIVNNDHFATWQAGKGISYLSNTEDGFANYDSTDLSTATALQNVNDGTGRTITASKTVNAIRHAPGAAQTNTLNAGVVLTIGSGGLLTNANQAIAYNPAASTTGQGITSGTGELNVFVQQNTTTIAVPITGAIALTKAGSGTLALTGANTYSGITYVGQGSGGASGTGGALNAGVTGANGTTTVAIPGDLQIHSSTVNVTVAGSIANASNVYLYGGGILNMRDAASTTETLNSINFPQGGGGDANPRAIVSRANQQATSTLNLTGATPISATNDNPTSTPAFSQNLGRVAFAGADGSPQTLMINSPVSVNGLSAAGFIMNAGIVDVPAGVDDGGLVKAGTGMMTMGGNVASTFGAPASPTEVFNIQSGYVRVDSNDALGPVNAITTVQSGAVLLFNGNTPTGSLQLKSGSTIGITMNSTTLGAVGSTGTVDVPAGATTTAHVRDYFIPATNTGNIVINHKLTGAGNINLVGIDYAAGYNGGGLFQLRNTANDYSGTINVATNTVLEANSNTGTGATFGTAIINLTGGTLRVRDQGDNTTAAETINFGNTVNLLASSMIDVDRQGTVATNKTMAFGTLNLTPGAVLNTVYGTGDSINPNAFRTSFSQVDGNATLIKGGSRIIEINGYGGSFSGNVEVPGAQGLTLPKSGNLVLNAATNNISNLTVKGFHELAAGKSVSVSGTLEVGDNAGTVANGKSFNGTSYVAATTGATSGSLLVNTTATASAGTLKNKGVVAPSGGAATLTATSIYNTGQFNAYNNNLTLNGTIADDGATPSVLRVAGTGSGAVILPVGGHTYTGGTEVQSGTLRVSASANLVNPLSTGAIRTFGQPVSTVGANSQAINQTAGVLEFAAGANSITQSGTITNNGRVLVSSGTANLGNISGTSFASLTNSADFLAATVPGLTEGVIAANNTLDTSNTRPGNTGTFGVVREPRMGQTNVVTQNPVTGWANDTAFIYTGYFYDADGVFTIAENIDDSVLISIDGVTRVLSNSGTNPWQTVTSTATSKGQRTNTLDTANVNSGTPQGLTAIAANANLPAGWHTIEIRLHNGGGGAGPVVGNGFTNNYGFGLNPDGTMTLDGTQFFRPIDDGSGNLFRTAVYGKGNVDVALGATLNAGNVTATATTTVLGAAAVGNVESDTTTVGDGTNAATLSANYVRGNVLDIKAGSSATINSNGGDSGTSKVSTLTLAGGTDAWTGKLDLKNNDLVVQGGSLATLTNQVKQGRNGGAWNAANGLTSSTAAGITALGVIQNSDDGVNALVGTFSGQAVDKDSVLVKYTYNGDNNLDGVVNADDYFRTDVGYLSAGTKTGWRWGDYNYDGLIDIDDYFLMDVAYSLQSGTLGGSSAPAAPSAPSAAVPEPGTLSLLALGAAALLGRRRRTR